MECLMKSKFLVLNPLLYFFLLFINQNIIAQITSGAGKIKADSIVTENIPGNEFDSLQYLKHRREFAYMNYLDSLLRNRADLIPDSARIDHKTQKVVRKKRYVENHSAINKIINSYPLQLFFWFLAIIFICFILYKIISNNGFFDKPTKSNYEKEDENLDPELDNLSKYDPFIDVAEAKNDFNLATRYLFLQMLAILADKEIITFFPEKTNQDYLNEMPDEMKDAFSFLSLQYEYIWYGKFLVSKAKYLDLKNDFLNFINKFNTV